MEKDFLLVGTSLDFRHYEIDDRKDSPSEAQVRDRGIKPTRRIQEQRIPVNIRVVKIRRLGIVISIDNGNSQERHPIFVSFVPVDIELGPLRHVGGVFQSILPKHIVLVGGHFPHNGAGKNVETECEERK